MTRAEATLDERAAAPTEQSPEGLPAPQGEFVPYKALSRGAVASLAVGLFSLLGLIYPPLLALAAVGFFIGISGLRAIRTYPNELSGVMVGRIGTVLCALAFLGGIAVHALTYAYETPEGYQRIAFRQLQPTAERPELPVSPEALELNGKEVFIKGYVHPNSDPRGAQRGLKKCILVPDMGTCCFGGQPKLTDMIEVTLDEPLQIDYSMSLRKLAGTLRVDTRPKPLDGLGGVYYRLEAKYLDGDWAN